MLRLFEEIRREIERDKTLVSSIEEGESWTSNATELMTEKNIGKK